MSAHVAAASVAVGAVPMLGSAVLLARAAPQRPAAALLGTSGLLAVVGAVLGWGDDPLWVPVAVVGATAYLLALTCYPTVDRSAPGQAAVGLFVACAAAMLVWRSAGEAVGSLGLVMALVLLAHTWWRIERAAGADRRALQWMALTVGSTSCVVLIVTFAWDQSPWAAAPLFLLGLVGPAMLLGVRSPDLVDVRAVVVRVVVRAVTVLCFVAVLAPLLAAMGSRADQPVNEGAVALVAGLLALLVPPFQTRLHHAVDELLFGPRPDPWQAASRLVRQPPGDPVTALAAVRDALSLPYAALWLDGDVVAESGVRAGRHRRLPVDAGVELEVAVRPGDLDLDVTGRDVVRVAGRLLGQAVRAEALAADLARSRRQAVRAREEERRRLRNELHDDVGPRLAGVAATADAAGNLVRADPEAARELLHRLRAEVGQAIADIRVVVYAMRPPALDELGLAGAVRQLASTLPGPDGEAPAVTVVESGPVGGLPAAVEVAAYRILAEAVLNAARHAGGRADVRIERSTDRLDLEVRDHACGGEGWTAGVGLSSMRERADELGGTLVAGPTGDGGVVRASLPVPAPAEPAHGALTAST